MGMAGRKTKMSNILSGDNSDLSKHFHKILDSTFDGTGTTNMATTADEYGFKPATGELMEIQKIIITLSDATIATHVLYGGITALSTGSLLKIRDDSTTTRDLLDTEVLKTNADLARQASWWNISNETASSLLTFVWDFGNHPVPLTGSATNERISFEVQDDLSALVDHTVAIYGFNTSKF